MTIHHEFLDDFGVRFVRIEEPQPTHDTLAFLSALRAGGGPSTDLTLPAIVDLRGADLAKWTSGGFRDQIGKVKAVDARLGRGASAYVVRDEGAFGMMRMFTTLSDVSGYRDAENSFVTLEIDEAAMWIGRRLGLGADRTDALTTHLLGAAAPLQASAP